MRSLSFNKQGCFMRHQWLAMLTIVCLSGCQLPQHQAQLQTELDGPLAQLQVDSRQLYTRMQKLTADKSCSADNQCSVLGIGQRACGGPEQFLVFSLAKTDQKLLSFTADRYRKTRQEQQQRLGEMSICQQLPTPTAACQLGKCVLLP
jgi:hypothetical protein